MNKYDSWSRDKLQKRKGHRNCEKQIQYLLNAEGQLPQTISASTPLPEVLNGICSALDCQIGNVLSLIYLPKDDAIDLAAIAVNTEVFGLHIFFSSGVVEESGEELGSLEMYCCVPRSPSLEEYQLIEQATCLAAIAIKLDIEADNQNR